MHRASAQSGPLEFYHLPSHPTSYGSTRWKDLGITYPLPAFAPGYLDAPLGDGLRTPPADDMGTTYQQPQYSYGRQEPTYPTPTTSGGYVTNYTGSNVPSKPYSLAQQPRPVAASTLRHEVQLSQPGYAPQSPQINNMSARAVPEEVVRRPSVASEMIVPNLQIPTSINDSGGSLAEFAAQITCLFWFEPTETLQKAERMTRNSSPVKRLRDEAIPSSGFRKWVVTILSTTQVTQNVILLALLFIYRLKTINPAVKGRVGSEYRLLTVALMLGNKFLDDNTYTNKTWAEVSGIAVTEIHVMEVEFLSNMRYSLLASKEQWQEWQDKLGRFWLYCDAATRAPAVHHSPLAVPSLPPTLPSPPHSMQASPPTLANMYTPSPAPLAYNNQTWAANNNAAPFFSPLSSIPDMHARKRSYGGDGDEPAQKRQSRSSSVIPPMRTEAPRLPIPNLTISTQPYTGAYSGNTPVQNAPLLPPLGGRAMSAVYPSSPWTPQPAVSTPGGQSSQYVHSANASGYTTPRRQSPIRDLLSIGSSPISANFTNHNSPSFYLQQRASPYKPVRHVNTLLYPPPSASMHDYPLNLEQIHYQPLAKRRGDYRPGLAYPPYNQWPVLPQPNFQA